MKITKEITLYPFSNVEIEIDKNKGVPDHFYIAVSGNTKPHRQFLKKNGVIWDEKNTTWWTRYGTAAKYETLNDYFRNIDGGEMPYVSKLESKSKADETAKLAEQWQKVADSCQKKSDDILSRLKNKATHTRRMISQYSSAKNDQEKWNDVADAAQVVANGFKNKTMPEAVSTLILTLKPTVGSDAYNNPLYPFCKYRHYSDYGGTKDHDWNFERAKPKDFTTENCVLVRDYILGKSTQVPEDPKQKELEKLIQDVKFGKIVGFFPTPQTVIERMMQLADIQPYEHILEPSAGIGSIADEIKKQFPNESNYLVCVEQNYSLAKILELKGYNVQNEDFLKYKNQSTKRFNKIIMNPPFENGQDGEHIKYAFDLLYPEGRIVAIAGEGIFFRSDKKSVAFREFVDEYGYSEKLPDDSFNGKDSFRKTGVATRIVVIDKPVASDDKLMNVEWYNYDLLKTELLKLKLDNTTTNSMITAQNYATETAKLDLSQLSKEQQNFHALVSPHIVRFDKDISNDKNKETQAKLTAYYNLISVKLQGKAKVNDTISDDKVRLRLLALKLKLAEAELELMDM
jgi:Methyltransferase small domain